MARGEQGPNERMGHEMKEQLKYAQSLIGKLVDTPTNHNDTPYRVELTSDACGLIVMVHFSGGESFPLGDVQLAKNQ